MKKNDDPDRKKYNLLNWNCMHFVKEVIEAGDVDMPRIIDPRPNAYIEKVRNKYPEIDYEKKESK